MQSTCSVWGDGQIRAAAISVVVPTRNRPEMLSSLLRPFAEWPDTIEPVVVDDASDAPYCVRNRQICEALNITYRLQPRQLGAPAARNRGLRESAAEMVWFIDDDDIVPEATIASVLKLLSAGVPDKCVILLPMDHVRHGVVVDSIRPVNFEHSFERYRRRGHVVNTSSAIFSRALLNQISAWDETLLGGQDTDLFLRASQLCSFICLTETAPVRVELGHRKRLTYRVFRQQRAKIQFLRKNWRLLATRRKAYYFASGLLWLPLWKYLGNTVFGSLRTGR